MTNPRSSRSGGFFLMIAIVAGFGWGLVSGDPLGGALLGTGAGALAALAVWLLDRRKA